MVRRGLKKEKLKKILVARVHADQVPILKNLKGTVHIICVCDYFLSFCARNGYFLWKFYFLEKILKNWLF
jgi:hypothetical protein